MNDRQARWRGWKLVLLLAGWVLLLGGVSGLRAQAGGPEMNVSAAWDGLVRKPGWVEIRTTLENEGGDWEGYLELEDRHWQIHYRLPIQLPAHAHKVYRLPLFVDGGSKVEIVLRDEGGHEMERRQLSLRAHAYDERLCVAADPLATMVLGSCTETLVLQQPTMMPETAPAWDNIDLLVMRDFPTAEMSTAQQEALQAWVAAGGHLILLGGPAMESMLEGLPPSLRPACTESRQLAAEGGDFTFCRRVVGAGNVDRLERSDPAGLDTLWQKESVPAVTYPLATGGATQNTALSAFHPDPNSLFTTPRSVFPSPLAIFLFALLYLILLIPVPYLITRRLHRPMLTWVLIPAVVLLTSLCLALWLSGFAVGDFPITHEMSFVFVFDAGEPARQLSFGATLAPRTGYLAWSVPGLFRPAYGSFDMGTGPWMTSGNPYTLTVRPGEKETRIETTSPAGVFTWGWETLTYPPTVTLQGELAGDHYLMRVESERPMRLQGIVLYDNYLLTVGDEWIEGSLELSRPLTEMETIPFYDYENRLAPCADALLGDRGGIALPPLPPGSKEFPDLTSLRCYLITDLPDGEGLSTASIRGKTAHEGCFIYLVPCPALREGILFPIPVGHISVVDGGGWVAPDPRGDTYFPSGATQVVLSVEIPAFFRQQGKPERVALTLEFAEMGPPSASAKSPWTEIDTVAIWDWEGQRWIEQPKPVDGNTLELAPASSFLNADGEIRFRLTGTPLPTMAIKVAIQFGEPQG